MYAIVSQMYFKHIPVSLGLWVSEAINILKGVTQGKNLILLF